MVLFYYEQPLYHQYCKFFISKLALAFWKANSCKVYVVPVPVKRDYSVVLVKDDSLDSDDSETSAAVVIPCLLVSEC